MANTKWALSVHLDHVFFLQRERPVRAEVPEYLLAFDGRLTPWTHLQAHLVYFLNHIPTTTLHYHCGLLLHMLKRKHMKLTSITNNLLYLNIMIIGHEKMNFHSFARCQGFCSAGWINYRPERKLILKVHFVKFSDYHSSIPNALTLF